MASCSPYNPGIAGQCDNRVQVASPTFAGQDFGKGRGLGPGSGAQAAASPAIGGRWMATSRRSDCQQHPSLEESAAWAGHWHATQQDKAGQPYVGHLVRVSRHLLRLFPDASTVERHAAWLHDLLEDTEVTAADLSARGYAPEVIATVQAVTKSPDPEMTYAQRIERLAREGTVSAIRVKLADLSDNSDPDRLAQLPGNKAASLGARYLAAKQRLFEELDRRSGDQDANGSSQPE
ncbi:hypothetical protein CDZ98_19405 [Mameliella alba]|nr:hypothetical protein CDZ98_19405 [Mameliella alba]